ncbi:MAG: ABC transporter substrate-binding protein [Pseudomonadota bacterium]
MRSRLYAGAAALAFSAGIAQADGHLIFPVGEGGFNWDSYNAFAEKYDLSGQVIEITGTWTGNEKVQVDNAFAYFGTATGAEVRYNGSESFENDIVISTQSGSAPDIAVFPQPGLATDLAAKGFLHPLPDGTADWIVDNYSAGQSWVDLATYADPDGNDQLFGIFYRADVKSLVWYSPIGFDEAGYEVPETMEELKELTDLIVEDGETPWCIGIGSQAATGWPATDWVEDMLLRTQPPDVYDKWVANEIPFDDPRILGAIEEYGSFARNEEYVDGGSAAVASTDFRDSPAGLFSIPPKCYLHRQASFIPAFFPDGTEIGEDVDFFYFPAFDSQDLGKPVLGAGTLAAITKPSEAAYAFIEWMKTPIAHELWMAQGNFITAHAGVNAELYADESLRAQGEILQNATTFRFDGSDLMPGEIGAGAFWTGMVDYTTGASAEEVAQGIQQRWDAIQ